MTEWDVVLVIGGILSILAVIIPPIIKLNTTITKLNTIVEQVSLDFRATKEKNTDTHKRLWDKNEEQDNRIENHEIRINNLENRRE